MEVNDFELLLIDVTFYPKHVQKLLYNVPKNNNDEKYNRDRRLKW